MTTTCQFSDELQAAAQALRKIRQRLSVLLAEGNLPGDMIADAGAVLVLRSDIILSLERLASR